MKNVILTMLISLALIACSSDKEQKQETPKMQVKGMVVKAQNMFLSFEYPARFKSVQQSSVYARVEGVLLAQDVKEGDIVKEGEHLFKIDPTRYQAKVNMAKAQYDAAKANFTKAEKDWLRVSKLYKQGVLTIDQYDTSQFNYASAKANVDNTKAALDDAMIDLGYTDVVASMSGRIGMRRYDVGNVVGRSGQDVLTTITQLSPIYAEFSIPSNDFYYMRHLNKDNIAVEFILNNGNTYEHKGKVDFIDSVLDTQTNSIKARAIVDNDKFALLPNDFVRVKLQGFEAQDVIAIPQSALLQDSQGSYVYTLKGDKPSITRVTLGQNLKDAFVLISSGLQNGDIVITSHLAKINPTISVSVDTSDSPSAPTNPPAEALLDSNIWNLDSKTAKDSIESNLQDSKKISIIESRFYRSIESNNLDSIKLVNLESRILNKLNSQGQIFLRFQSPTHSHPLKYKEILPLRISTNNLDSINITYRTTTLF
ncbi:efflux RND transporter periplasmic adaptor subunit [Helicobacter saguini]|uniref:Efflux RND transporter periplasmic adaptor subunit n=1 Tax=Helicobacter saguini TaxID=1548018 RepID=A0A347VRL3_9HELI|nr:efflux RND transporter periplasmic adaptor subunit [Helicobacter saguini]MWV62860.1 efflux RND transporter periplasmic adaptor subunit [Helicobacter saguini]MWV66469.1 efflux RND transporter periplasmic adaptor subunit [Helicobacter saguini]MWV68819.1 efflux RND transporter periplasmic adaptor subunit [Helicobacter saguini]MWV71626.1 efflux RND transporter periplasmic adaptor subunit [Helicobacter saguini]TLD94430.1 efflux RND transporter periplasmic adaptor subunit [Helicobacter saguini]